MISLDADLALRERAITGAIAARRQIAVTGADRASFLQGLLTNDISSLTSGRGCYAAWLTPQGRMLTDLHVLESGDMILLDVPADDAEQTAERLEQFHFTEDVQIASLADSLRATWLHGPGASQILETLAGGDGRRFADWGDYQNARVELAGVPVVVARIDQIGVPGYVVYAGVDHENAVMTALAGAGAVAASASTLEAARIEAGYPVFGVDMTTDTIPLEAGIENRAISLTKGCYVGQEVIIRVLHRGHGRVARKLVGLRIEGPVPQRGETIFAGDRQIGTVTSAAESPRSGAAALGYVHREFTADGTEVQVGTGAGRSGATVTARLIS
jgi:folate-binding protein YgfZ